MQECFDDAVGSDSRWLMIGGLVKLIKSAVCLLRPAFQRGGAEESRAYVLGIKQMILYMKEMAGMVNPAKTLLVIGFYDMLKQEMARDGTIDTISARAQARLECCAGNACGCLVPQ